MFEGIKEEKIMAEKRLEESDKARQDLLKVLNETSMKGEIELGKLNKLQDIMLAENRAVCGQFEENRSALLAKEVECDKKEVTIALQVQEIESLKLTVAELQAYKSRYE